MTLHISGQPHQTRSSGSRDLGGGAMSMSLQPTAARAAALGVLSLYLWIALNGMDALLTWRGIPMGAFEVNPALAALAHHTSVPTMLLVKLLIASLIGVAIWRRRKVLVLTTLNVLMLGVVTFNAVVIAFFL